MMRALSISRLVSLCALTVAAGSAQAASTVLDLSAQLAYDSNMSNAEAASDREEGFILSGAAAARSRTLLGDSIGLQYGARLEVDGNERYGDLNRLGVGGNVGFNFKPVPGYTMPWYAVDASVMLSQFADSDLRDSVHGSIGATMGKRLTDRISGRLGYAFDWRSAFGGSAFDTTGHGLFAGIDYSTSWRMQFYARYDVRMGDVVSTATPTAKVINAAEVIEADDVFGKSSVPAGLIIGPGIGPGLGLGPGLGPGAGGPGLGPLGNNQRFAYRIDAISHQGQIGANYALSQDMSIDLSARYRKTLGDGDNDYQSITVQGALLYRFR